MKKITNIVLSLATIVGLASCNSNNITTEKTSNNPIVDSSSILVAYFSATGTTRIIANKISQNIDAEMFEIEAAIPYTEADLDYYSGGRCDLEQADSTSRPKIKNQITNIDSYDTIFLGYPIWHGQAPRIISTFLESYDLSGKTIIPFCTSNSSGIGSSDDNLHSIESNAKWVEGRRFSASASDEEVNSWIESLDLVFSVSKFNLKNAKNGVAPKVRLNNGLKMPILGLGTYSLTGDAAYNSVLSALAQGYRLIDTAHMYGNEEEIGRAIRDSGIPRNEIFLITKIYPGNQFNNPEEAIELALSKLDIEYIDMMLLHHPGINDVKAYKAIEKYISDGKIKAAGLSNWYIEEIDDFISKVDIMPALIQNEIHPYYQETEVVKYMHNLGIAMQAWYPLGGRGHTQELLNDEVIKSIAENHNVSSAQVILRWDLQNGVIAIPGSSNPAHQKENISIFEFELTDEEMKQMNSLNRNEKHDWY